MIFVLNNARNLWNDIAAALNLDPIPDLHAKALDFIHIVERGTADGRAADGDWLQGSNWREFPGTADLNQNVLNFSNPGARCVFVCNRPTRSFAGVPQFAPQ